MSLELKTAPAKEPISVLDARDWANVEHGEDDAVITRGIPAARLTAEDITGRAFITQTWTWKVDSFYSLRVPKPPLQGINTIKYIDDDGIQQTLSSSVYTITIVNGLPRIVLAYDQDWPSFRCQPDPIEIEIVCGYGDDPDDVPGPIIEALLVMVTDKLENRESTALVPGAKIAETISAARNMLQPYVVDLY